MFKIIQALCIGAVVCSALSLSGCYNRPSPYGYGAVPPPGYCPQQYPQQYRPPNGYYPQQQPYNGSGTRTGAANSNWQVAPTGNLNASVQPFTDGTVGTAGFNEPVREANLQFNSETFPNSGPNNDAANSQPNLGPQFQQMPVNQPDPNFQSQSRSILVPINGQPVSPQFFNTAPPAGYVPIDPGAIVAQPAAPFYPNHAPQYAPAYYPTNHLGTTGGVTVAQNSTITNHNAQWTVPR